MKPSAVAALELIDRDQGACLWDFAAIKMGRFGARIYELRKLGYVITSERCRRHPHQNYVETYSLLAVPDPSGQISIKVSG